MLGKVDGKRHSDGCSRVGVIPPGIHGSTFGGNPLACAAAVATLEVLAREQLPKRAAESGAYLMSRLDRIKSPLIREVRGLGLMVGIEIRQKVAPFIKALTNRGVLALPAGMTVIRLLPPLVINRTQIDHVTNVFAEVLKAAE